MALDASISLGPEAAYGTAATLFKGYEGKADSWKTSREFLESVGFRAGLQTARADRRRIVNMGGEGEIECDVLDAGSSALFAAVFDEYSSAVDTGTTTHTFNTASVGNGKSFTAEMVRPKEDGGVTAFRHVGCAATTFTLSQEVDSQLSLTVGFDFQDVSHGAAPAVAEYPAVAFPYDWTVGLVEVKRGVAAWAPIDVTEWSVEGELGLKTDRRFVRNSALKKKPVRAAVPSYSGSLTVEFSSVTLSLYEDFLAGKVLGVRITYVGKTADGDGTVSGLTLTMPAVQFTGESPEASLDDVTTMALPFRVLDPGNGTDDAITLVYKEPTPV